VKGGRKESRIRGEIAEGEGEIGTTRQAEEGGTRQSGIESPEREKTLIERYCKKEKARQRINVFQKGKSVEK